MTSRPASTLRFRRDRSGSVAVTTVMASGLLFGMAAITVDASRFYLLKRQQQGMADLAAIAAAANLPNARAAAAASLAANGVPARNLASVELGTYLADPSVAPAQRFTAGTATPNAARVTLRSLPSAFFGALVGTANATVGTRSIAANANVAAFGLSSTAAGFDKTLANGVLGGLTRSTPNLSAADYAGLAATNVDLFGLAKALAARVGTTGTYASLASSTVRVADVVGAAADAAAAGGASTSTVAALRALATAIGVSGPSLSFGSLVSFGAYGSLAVGSPAPVAASLPLLSLVAATARLGNGPSEISVGLGSSAPSILAANAKIVSGGVSGSSYATVGPVGTTLHTAQTRVLLTLQLAQFGIVTGLNLPVYVETAPATATLSAIGCSAGATIDPAATLSVTPGAVDGWIGNVSDAALTDLTSPVNPSAAVLTDLLAVSVSGRAHATVSNTAPVSVSFTQDDIAAGRTKTTSTTDYTGSLLSELFKNLQLSVGLLGVSAGIPAGVPTAIGALLQADLAPIDATLSNTLSMLGITVGDATTSVRAVRCGQGALVN